MNNVIITQIKNQEERVYDWILYHFKEGFDTFIFFDDFSQDSTISEIKRFEEDFGVKVYLYQTDERGRSYSINESKYSETYGSDDNLNNRIRRSYTKGNDFVKSVNPEAICCFLDVDEFLVTNENKKVTEVVKEIFEKEKCNQIFIYNFDILHDYKLEKNLIHKNENYYRWDFNDVNSHSVWKDRKKCITFSKSTGIVFSVHEINKVDGLSFESRDYNKLRMHHFRIPNLPNSSSIKFVLDNTVKEKMILNDLRHSNSNI